MDTCDECGGTVVADELERCECGMWLCPRCYAAHDYDISRDEASETEGGTAG